MNKEVEKVKAQHIKAKSQRIKSDGDDRLKWGLEELELR
jgi:hypothetical protein